MRPLPTERFACFREAQRMVNRDGHVEVAKAYYSAPPEYLGRRVWVRWDARVVRIFNHRFEQIAVHARHEPGRFSTLALHLVAEKISGIERGAEWLLSKVRVHRATARPTGPAPCSRPAASRGCACCKACWRSSGGIRVTPSRTLARWRSLTTHSICAPLRQLVQRKAAKQQPLPFLDGAPDHSAAVGLRQLVAGRTWRVPQGRDQRPQVPSLPPLPRRGPPNPLPSSLLPILEQGD